MKVLFVSSGNRGVSPVVHNQGDSLFQHGVNVSYFPIMGKGFIGYLSNISKLRDYVVKENIDVVHAHYSLSAFVASLAMVRPLVVSLMGSDVKKGKTYRYLIKVFAFLFSWKQIIVKSEDMKTSLKKNDVQVIPNGVDMNRFCEMDKTECQKKLGWNNGKTHLLFPANIKRPEKNFALLQQSVKELSRKDVEIHWFDNVPNEETPIWYNAADVVVMASLWEGSPNAIKEAMACNRPIVTTDVGDVRWLLGEVKGCFISSFSSTEYSEKIKEALTSSDKANGRQRIIDLGLSNDLVAKRIIDIYNVNLRK